MRDRVHGPLNHLPSTEGPRTPTQKQQHEPHLFLVHQADRPFAPCARFRLSELETVAVTRGQDFSFARNQSTRTLVIELPDSWVSGRHARLKQVLGRWIAEDLHSRNGTFLNHAPLESAHLSDGDLLEVGHTTLIYRESLATMPDEPGEITSTHLKTAPGLATLLPDLARQFSTLVQIARSKVPVVIEGESGTGKELVARAVHELSRPSGPFVAVNCDAIPAGLLESELFGYRKGSFSGAVESRTGLIRAAEGGTLFLDEIADLPPSSQGSLLRVLQEHHVLPLGEVRPIPVDIRVCVASNRNLEQMVARNQIRGDLFARLSGFALHLPPLRQRREDLGLLISALLRRILAEDEAGRVSFHRNAARALFRYHWPFNIRELERCLEAAVVLARKGQVRLEHLPPPVRASFERPAGSDDQRPSDLTDDQARLLSELTDLLTQQKGNVAAVARALGKKPMQIRRWAKRFNLELSKFRS